MRVGVAEACLPLPDDTTLRKFFDRHTIDGELLKDSQEVKMVTINVLYHLQAQGSQTNLMDIPAMVSRCETVQMDPAGWDFDEYRAWILSAFEWSEDPLPSLDKSGSISNPTVTETHQRFLRIRDNTRHPVYIGYTFYLVKDIDSKTGTFSATFKLLLKWHDTDFERDADILRLRRDGHFADGTGPFERTHKGRFEDYLVKLLDEEDMRKLDSMPTVGFANAVSVEEDVHLRQVYISPNDKPGLVRLEQTFQGTFLAQMDLHAFPFDAQELPVIVRLPFRADYGRQLELLKEKTEIKDWIKLAEWSRYVPDCKASEDSKGRAKFVIRFPVVRKSGFFVWNVLGVVFMITLLNFLVAFMHRDNLGNRLSVLFTLLLTTVAFKFTISDKLPAVPYFTVADQYFSVCMMMPAILSWTSAAAANGLTEFADHCVFVTAAIFFFVFNVGFAYRAYLIAHHAKARIVGHAERLSVAPKPGRFK